VLLGTMFLQCSDGEPITLSLAVGSAIALSGSIIGYDYLKCKVYECCNDKWVMLNVTNLTLDLNQRLYGQHLVIDTVVRALKAHTRNPEPKKALVISFHGWTGCGKNFVADMIALHFYSKGKCSSYVKMFLPELLPCDKNGVDCSQNLQAQIAKRVALCPQSLFIFDEMDHFDPKLINAIKPFLDFHNQINGIDFRKSIFIFISNTGGDDISSKTFEHWKTGKARNEITLADMDKVIMDAAYNEEGGFKFSPLIKNNLIDHFVPFLPMERSHVIMCIKDYLKSTNPRLLEKFVTNVADSLQYFPKGTGLFSTSGCKRISQKVDLLIQEELEAHEIKGIDTV